MVGKRVKIFIYNDTSRTAHSYASNIAYDKTTLRALSHDDKVLVLVTLVIVLHSKYCKFSFVQSYMHCHSRMVLSGPIVPFPGKGPHWNGLTCAHCPSLNEVLVPILEAPLHGTRGTLFRYSPQYLSLQSEPPGSCTYIVSKDTLEVLLVRMRYLYA